MARPRLSAACSALLCGLAHACAANPAPAVPGEADTAVDLDARVPDDDLGLGGSGGPAGGGMPIGQSPGDVGDAGAASGGSGLFDPRRVYLIGDVETDHTLVIDPERFVTGRPAAYGNGFISAAGRLIYQHSTRDESLVREFVCDTPCIGNPQDPANLAKSPGDNDQNLGSLVCGNLLLSRDDELFDDCGTPLADRGDAVAVDGLIRLISVHSDRLALVEIARGSGSEIALAALSSGQITPLSSALLPNNLAARQVRTTDDGFWAVVSAADIGEDARRYHVSRDGLVEDKGVFPSLKNDSARFALSPGTLSGDGMMYRVVPYTKVDGKEGVAVLRTRLGMAPVVLLDTAFQTWFRTRMMLLTGS